MIARQELTPVPAAVRRRHGLALVLGSLLAATASLAADKPADPMRYRGDYTLAHEVNIFCPHSNSQCYWLSPATGATARAALAQLAGQYRREDPYTPVCVVVSGSIDRETLRQGFAADYAGLIRVDHVYGECGETSVVTQADLRHHRWVLTAINGAQVPAGKERAQAALDFGERLFYSANDPCQTISGFARLERDDIVFGQSTVDGKPCSAGPRWADELPSGRWRILLPEKGVLLLQRDGARLEFALDDWR